MLWRTLPGLLLVLAVWALVASFFTVDVTEYGLGTRFGRVVRVIEDPGLHLAAPLARVVRLDKRVLYLRPPRSEYLTTDKKNIVVESLVTWRIVDPQRFVATVVTRGAAEERLSDIVLAEIGSVVGRYAASPLIRPNSEERRYRRHFVGSARGLAGL